MRGDVADALLVFNLSDEITNLLRMPRFSISASKLNNIAKMSRTDISTGK